MRYWLLAALVAVIAAADVRAQGEIYLGGGIHYWRTLDDIESEREFEDEGVAYLLSLQIAPSRFVRLEGALEIFPDGFASADDTTYAPQIHAILGSTVYLGLGVGAVYNDEFEDNLSEPFYVARVGLNMEMLPNLHLDVYGNYHFLELDELDEIDDEADADTITLAAVLRFEL